MVASSIFFTQVMKGRDVTLVTLVEVTRGTFPKIGNNQFCCKNHGILYAMQDCKFVRVLRFPTCAYVYHQGKMSPSFILLSISLDKNFLL